MALLHGTRVSMSKREISAIARIERGSIVKESMLSMSVSRNALALKNPFLLREYWYYLQ